MKVQEAVSRKHGHIGYRLFADDGSCLLAFADQQALPGFRVGDSFTPGIDDEITYYDVDLGRRET